MLFKFSVAEAFAEVEDRVGCIEAPSLEDAVQALIAWVEGNCDDNLKVERAVEYRGGHALVSCRAVDEDGVEGWDRYHVEAVDDPVFAMMIDGWRLYFTPFSRTTSPI